MNGSSQGAGQPPARDREASFDDRVFEACAALTERGALAPHALFFLGTGAGVLPGRLEAAGRLPLAVADSTPAAWRETLLHFGHLGGLPVWLIEDAPLDTDGTEPAWERAFPVWLAAAAGAVTLVHTSAGSALDTGAASLPVGTLALVSDHLNLSGSTPLVGLGNSRLGPMFPDQTLLHDRALRTSARGVCERLGLSAREVVAAGTVGPSLETPAERRWFTRAGAEVSVQRLATTLIAAAHAGLGTLAVVLVTHSGDGPIDIARVAATSTELAPALDDLLWELARSVEAEATAELERGVDRDRP